MCVWLVHVSLADREPARYLEEQRPKAAALGGAHLVRGALRPLEQHQQRRQRSLVACSLRGTEHAHEARHCTSLDHLVALWLAVLCKRGNLRRSSHLVERCARAGEAVDVRYQFCVPVQVFACIQAASRQPMLPVHPPALPEPVGGAASSAVPVAPPVQLQQ